MNGLSIELPHLSEGDSSVTKASTVKRKCKAHKKSGEPCGNYALRGQLVCRFHGGGSAHARQAAQRRLLALVEPALATLHKILHSRTASDTDKLRAAVQVLDRTGYSAETILKLEPAEPDRWQQAMEGFLEGLGQPSELEELPDASEDADDRPARSRRDRNGQPPDGDGVGDFAAEWSDPAPRSRPGMGDPNPPKYQRKRPPPTPRSGARRISR